MPWVERSGIKYPLYKVKIKLRKREVVAGDDSEELELEEEDDEDNQEDDNQDDQD